MSILSQEDILREWILPMLGLDDMVRVGLNRMLWVLIKPIVLKRRQSLRIKEVIIDSERQKLADSSVLVNKRGISVKVRLKGKVKIPIAPLLRIVLEKEAVELAWRGLLIKNGDKSAMKRSDDRGGWVELTSNPCDTVQMFVPWKRRECSMKRYMYWILCAYLYVSETSMVALVMTYAGIVAYIFRWIEEDPENEYERVVFRPKSKN